jgi:hypothetical protein
MAKAWETNKHPFPDKGILQVTAIVCSGWFFSAIFASIRVPVGYTAAGLRAEKNYLL